MAFHLNGYSNFHDDNQDWIVSKIKSIEDAEAHTGELADAAQNSADAAQLSADASQASADAAQLSADAAQQSAEDSAASAQDSYEHAAETLNTAASIRADMTTLNNRMDNIIAGGTPTEGNTELIDIRVGANGFTYPTAGDAVRDQVTNIKNAVETAYVEQSIDWEMGSFYTSNGTKANSATNIRTTEKLGVSNGYAYVNALEGYQFAIFAYNKNTNVYAGVLKTNGTFETTTSNIAWLNSFSFSQYPEMNFNIVGQRTDSGNMAVDESVNFPTYSYTDKTLTEVNKPADAKATGDKFITVDNVFETLSKETQITKEVFAVWDIGGIANGYNTGDQYTIRTRNFMLLKAGDRFKCPKNMNFSVISFNTAKDGDVDVVSPWSQDYTVQNDCIARIRYKNVVNSEVYTDADAIAATLTTMFVYRTVADYFRLFPVKTRMIAHRGYNPGGANNTITAFKNACVDYFDGIETDVSNTSDGVLMCRHNADIPGYGNINTLPYDTVKDIVIDTNGDTIPLFSDYLKICRAHGKTAFIEIKNVNDKSLIYDMCDIIKNLNMEYNSVIMAMSLNDIITAKNALPETYGFYIGSEVNVTDEYLAMFKLDGIGYDCSTVRDTDVETLHENGIACGVWTIDTSADKDSYRDIAVDSITTNTIE